VIACQAPAGPAPHRKRKLVCLTSYTFTRAPNRGSSVWRCWPVTHVTHSHLLTRCLLWQWRAREKMDSSESSNSWQTSCYSFTEKLFNSTTRQLSVRLCVMADVVTHVRTLHTGLESFSTSPESDIIVDGRPWRWRRYWRTLVVTLSFWSAARRIPVKQIFVQLLVESLSTLCLTCHSAVSVNGGGGGERERERESTALQNMSRNV